MKEFIDKLIGRLEEAKEKHQPTINGKTTMRDLEVYKMTIGYAISIVNELAEEYKTSYMDELVEARRNCSEDSDCSQCLFGQIKDRCILAELQIDFDVKKNNDWIPCSERLPSREEYQKCNGQFIVSDGNRTYATYFDIYDTLKFGEPTMDKFKVDKCVIAWMPLPAHYQQKEGE